MAQTIKVNGTPEADTVHSRNGDAAVRKFTWRELSKLNEPHNAHIAYRGKVYDVSKFASQHPGGVDQILCAAGRDITLVFEAYHDLPKVTKILDKFYVGELVDNEFPVFPEMGLFYRTLKQRVNEYLKANNMDRKVEFWSLFKNILVTIIVLSTWFLSLLWCSGSLSLALLSASVCGIFSASFLLSMHHDSNHCAITHKPWVWRALQLFSESVLGISSYCWKHEHNLGHHPYTNLEPDPDIPTKPPTVWRVKRSQRWMWFYVFQHLYMPLVYSLMAVKYRIEDFLYVYKRERTHIRMNPLTRVQWVMFWTGKIVFCLYRYVVPYFYVPFWNLVLVNLACDVGLSLVWGNLNMANHLSTGVILPPKPDENNVMPIDWATLQILTTCDYCTESWFWFLVSGGITHQAAHHLFPDMAQAHYQWVTPLLKKTCAEFGIQYNSVDSFSEAWKMHIQYLKKMGSGINHGEKSG